MQAIMIPWVILINKIHPENYIVQRQILGQRKSLCGFLSLCGVDEYTSGNTKPIDPN